MSTDFYGSIYKKINDEWKLIYRNINMNCVKNFMNNCWDINANEVYNVDDSLKSLVYDTEKFETYKLLGSIEKSKLLSNCIKYIKQGEFLSSQCDSIPLLFNENDVDYLHNIIKDISKDPTIDINEYVKLSTEEKKKIRDKNYYVYVTLCNHYNGNFYNANSFDSIIKLSREKLKEIEENNKKWKEISTSLDYLKLSQDEKENIWDSFKYEIEDEDNNYTYKLESALQLKHTLQLFSDWDDDNVLFYIYNDESYKLQDDLPEWLNSKIGGF